MDIVKKAVVTQFATETGPLVPQTNDLLQNGGGGEGGVWMSGMGPATDGHRLFVVTVRNISLGLAVWIIY